MIQDILKKHINFWDRADVDEPLVGKIPTRKWLEKPYPLKDDTIAHDPHLLTPDNFDLDKFTDSNWKNKPLFTGDFIPPLGYLYPSAWMESLIGCPIYVSAFGCVAKPATQTAGQFSIEQAMNSPWLKIMDEVLVKAVNSAAGQISTRQLHLRGVLDMLAAFFGEEKLCMGIFDNYEQLSALADKFADLYITVAKRGLNLRPQWNGGCVSIWQVYAPGELVDYQLDASSLFSTEMYQQYFLEFDRKVLSQFEYSTVHTHACGQHIIDCLLQIKELRAIQIQLDRETGVWDKNKIFDTCKKIQAASKCIIINGELTEDELAEFKSTLSPKGLAIYYWNP